MCTWSITFCKIYSKLGIQRRVEDSECKLNHAANYAVGFDNQVRSSARASQKLKYATSHSTLSLSGFSKQLQLLVYTSIAPITNTFDSVAPDIDGD